MKFLNFNHQLQNVDKCDRAKFSEIYSEETYFNSFNHEIAWIKEFFDLENDDDFVLTSSGQEAICHVLFSHYFKHMQFSGNNHIIAFEQEGKAVCQALVWLEKLGVCVTYLKPNEQGLVTQDILKEAITPRTSLVFFSWAHPISGIISPLDDLVSLAKDNQVFTCIDLSAAIGRLDFSMKSTGVDYVTFDASEFSSLNTCGGVLANSFSKLEPFIFGGSIQEKRGGDINLESLCSLTSCLKKLAQNLQTQLLEYPRLKKQFTCLLKEKVPGAYVFNQETVSLPDVIVFAIEGLTSEHLLFLLNEDQILATFGGGSFKTLESLLSYSNAPDLFKKGAISFKFFEGITSLDIEDVVTRLSTIYEKASPAFKHLMQEVQ